MARAVIAALEPWLPSVVHRWTRLAYVHAVASTALRIKGAAAVSLLLRRRRRRVFLELAHQLRDGVPAFLDPGLALGG